MELREYLFRNRIEVKDLSKKSGVNTTTLSTVKCQKTRPSFRTATKIVSATNHHVGYADLLPEIYDEMIKEYIMKTKGKSNE